MARREWVCVAGLLVAAGCGDVPPRSPDTSAAPAPVVSANSAVSDTAGCELATALAHDDAEALVREFVRRDAAGEFTATSAWFAAAVDCPGHEGAPDTATEARDPRVRVLLRATDSLRAEVRWERLAVGDAVMHDTEVDTIIAVRTPYGWRIRSPALNPHVPVPAPPSDSTKPGAPAT